MENFDISTVNTSRQDAFLDYLTEKDALIGFVVCMNVATNEIQVMGVGEGEESSLVAVLSCLVEGIYSSEWSEKIPPKNELLALNKNNLSRYCEESTKDNSLVLMVVCMNRQGRFLASSFLPVIKQNELIYSLIKRYSK